MKKVMWNVLTAFLIIFTVCFCVFKYISEDNIFNLRDLYYDYLDENNRNDADTVFFGNYRGEGIEWIVLDEKEGKKLLLSKYVLDAGRYCDQYGASSWEYSEVYDWLNNDFLYSAFNENQINQITYGTIEVEYYSREEVYENDEDVFILSEGEINHYSNLLGYKLQECYPTSYVADNYNDILAQSNDGNSEYEGEAICWVRSDYLYGVNMYPSSEVGWAVAEYNEDIAGIRPAIWIKN